MSNCADSCRCRDLRTLARRTITRTTSLVRTIAASSGQRYQETIGEGSGSSAIVGCGKESEGYEGRFGGCEVHWKSTAKTNLRGVD